MLLTAFTAGLDWVKSLYPNPLFFIQNSTPYCAILYTRTFAILQTPLTVRNILYK